MSERKVVIPGEIISSESECLPGENTEKRNGSIVATVFGVAEESNNLIKVIPISGQYQPRRGNVIVGTVVNILGSGWSIDIDTPENAFISLSEVPRYVNRGELAEVMSLGDTVVAKIVNIGQRGIDLTLRSHGLGKVEDGLVIKINSNKVPRVIGKEGSMINIIKEKTGCNITVGQNGVIWIKGDTMEKELLAKKAINFVTEKFFMNGLTDEMKGWFEDNTEGGE